MAGTVSNVAASSYGSMPSSMSQATSPGLSSSQQGFGSFGADGQIGGSVAASAPGGFVSGNVTGANMGAGFDAGPSNAQTNGFTAAGMDAGMMSPTSYGSQVASALSNTSNPYGAAPSSMTGITSASPAPSQNASTFGNIGLGAVGNPGVTGDLAASAPAGVNTGLGAYGLSTNELAGFDNFGSNAGSRRLWGHGRRQCRCVVHSGRRLHGQLCR